MAADLSGDGGPTYVLRTEVVRRAIADLLARQIHPYFPAYLHLRQRAGRAGRLDRLTPEWKALGEYLEVDGAPARRPYFRPFLEGRREAGQEWLNTNLAGSYAASSLRPGQAPLAVVRYDGATRTFALREEHWKLAREHLLNGRKAPVISLAAYFYRDFGIRSLSEPTPMDLMTVFRSDFGYAMPHDNDEFSHLYEVTAPEDENGWFDLLAQGDGA